MLMESINNNWGTTLTIGEDGRGHAITMGDMIWMWTVA